MQQDSDVSKGEVRGPRIAFELQNSYLGRDCLGLKSLPKSRHPLGSRSFGVWNSMERGPWGRAPACWACSTGEDWSDVSKDFPLVGAAQTDGVGGVSPVARGSHSQAASSLHKGLAQGCDLDQ